MGFRANCLPVESHRLRVGSMVRTRATAKQAGTSFETLVADYLAKTVDDRIERRRQSGAFDRGDISGLRVHDQRVVVECKNYGGKIQASTWLAEAEIERNNDGALAGVVAIKRRGTTKPRDQFVLMTLGTLASLITGEHHG